MEGMMEKDMIFLLVLLTAGALTMLCFWLDRRWRKVWHRQRLTDAQRNEYRLRLLSMERQLAAGQEVLPTVSRAAETGRDNGFAGSLQHASLRLRLQQRQRGSGGAVEKYRLVASMANRGLSVDDISDILKLSVSEIRQLLKLARLGQQAA